MSQLLPDTLYLTSLDLVAGSDLVRIRTCTRQCRVPVGDREDVWLYEVSPPFLEENLPKHTGGIYSTGYVLLATRHGGTSLASIPQRGLTVYVMAVGVTGERQDWPARLRPGPIWFWGDVFLTNEDAEKELQR